MTAATQTQTLAPSAPSLRERVYGFGSIFAKALRDSRRATLLTAGLLALIFLGVSKAIVTEFNTPESRLELNAIVAAVPPILQGLAGKVVNVGTLGGYLQYKYGTFFPMVLSLWSILALSGTLAAEARRGSLEFIASTPKSRRLIALEKLAGHLIPMTIAVLVCFISIAIAGATFATLPGDEISVTSAFGYSVWLGLMALAAGGVAFALAPFVGRGAAAGIAGFITLAGFLLNGYQAALPQLAPLANLTWYGWTSNHVALAGQYDWPSVALVAVVVVVLLVIGVEAFVRRDIGATNQVPTPSLPGVLRGLEGPGSRAAGQGLPSAIAWGLGVGLFGLLIAASGQQFLDQLSNSPQFDQLLAGIFPGINFRTVGGFLQLLFVEFGLIMSGLAAATLVSVWASDETSGRLEMLLAAPLARARYAVASGIGLLVDVAVFVVLTGAGITLGTLMSGGDIVTPMVGTLILAVYAIAVVGIGLAVGGIFGAGWATPVTVVFVIVTWFVQALGPLLNLPDVIQQFALPTHYGQPMVGVWDLGGVAASIVIAVGGIALGAWGFKRRDSRA